MFLAGFNQKTTKEDLLIKRNYRISLREQCGKTLEDSRRLSTEAGLDPLTCGAGWPHLEVAQPMGPLVSLPLLCRFSTTS
jgi:hypothetical protein